ncbi:hypothetical protein M0813_15020 [Anaeramoeba flamelloides]|uniref:BTB domain-containing protein n=1 Tax=Anaeramoeba flamelloides TaxID=1746091 RepID=A0ABQ8Z3L2_9EUKA|nr:hypothetical protein M0813_15020 [Anaeramoeba flamelloides]
MKSIKLVVVGDGGVGKTSLLITYTTQAFPSEYVPTVFDNLSETMWLDGEPVRLGIWDTAGGEDFDRLRPLMYPQTDVFFICFDISRPVSLKNAQSRWAPELQFHCPGTPFLLIGNKQDLRDDQTTIRRLQERGESPTTYEQGVKAAEEMGADSYLECSSSNQIGLTELFREAVRAVIRPFEVKKTGGLFQKSINVLMPLQFTKVSANYSKEMIKLISIDPKDELEKEDPKIYGSDIHLLWLKNQSKGESESESESENELSTYSSSEKEVEEKEKEKEEGAEYNSESEREIKKEKEEEEEKEKDKKKQKLDSNEIRHIINAHKSVLSGRCPIFQKILNKKIDTKKLERKLGIKSLGDGKYQMKSLSFSAFVLYIKFLYCENLDSLLQMDADRLFEFKDLPNQFENENLLKICECLNEKFTSKDQSIAIKCDQKISELIELESPKLLKCFEDQFESQKRYNNLILNVKYKNEKSKRVFVNKSLLFARTKYFKDLIRNQLVESKLKKKKKKKKNDQKNDNDIDGVDQQKYLELDVNIGFQPSLFSDLNQFLYTNDIKFKNVQHCVDLLALAKFVSQDTLAALCQIVIADEFIPKISNKKILKLYSDVKSLELDILSELIFYFMGLRKNKIKRLNQYKKIFSEKERLEFEKKFFSNQYYLRLHQRIHEHAMMKFGLKKIQTKDKKNQK